MPKLPKDVVADPRHDEVARLLTTHLAPLWEGGRHRVPTVALTPALADALRAASTARLACQGLEHVTAKLAAEQKGLDMARQKLASAPPSPRVSRLLLLANDGSTRFYRDCDALLGRYPERLIACRLDVAGAALGTALLGVDKLVRCVLVSDKAYVARVLLALVPAEP
ncbi:MAG: hypothetical protein IT373_18385 [Polyangiaceae bacterium]|nr:hypothetical protein [Polyangiaceae bacterium]